MDLLFDFLSSSSFPVTWLTVVLNVVVKGTVVLMAAALFGLVLQKASASVRYLVWSLALGTLIALPLLPPLLPAWQINLGSSFFSVALQPPVSTDSAVLASVLSVNEPAVAQEADGFPDAQVAPTHNSIVLEENPPLQERTTLAIPVPFSISRAHWTTWALMLWLAGVAAVFARLLVGLTRVWWLVRRAKPIVDDSWKTLLQELVDQMGLMARVKLLRSNQAMMPMTWGLIGPVILLPDNADQWSNERRRVVLIHELAHVKRRDWLVQVLAYAAYGLYWINPLVWIAVRRLRIERERACDDYVLGMGVRPSDYAHHLLQIARSLQSRSFSPLAVTMAHRSHLEGRLLAILNPRLHRGGLTPKTMTLSVALFTCIAVPLAAMSPAAGDQSDGEVVAAAEAQPVSEVTLDDVADLELIQPSAVALENAGQADLFPEERQQGLAQVESMESIENDRQAGSLATAPLNEHLEVPRATTLARLNSNLESYPEPRAQRRSRRSRNRRELRNVRDLEVLAEALDDPDPKVREMAIRALDRIRDESAVDLLIQALTDSSAEIRRRAARTLGKIEDPRAIQALATALNDEDPEVRQRVIEALGDIEDSRAVDWLIPLLTDPNVEIRREAARALGEIEDPGAVQALGTALNDEDLEVRQRVIEALGDIEDVSAVDWLILLLTDPNVEIRREAARALGEIGDPGAVQALAGVLEDPDLEVRQSVIRALGRSYDESAVDWLIPFVTDSNVEIRRRVAWALGQIGGTQAVEALNAASNDADSRVRRTVSRALREIGRR
jgi:HEAT repeat protein/beta-lactamase regulating signal transducer with metallopeptidase domain